MSYPQRQFVLAVALIIVACAPPPPPSPADAGPSFQDVLLTSPDPMEIALRKGESFTLHAVATDQASAPVADVPIEWSVEQGPAWLTQISGTPMTDASGTATATVTMQESSSPITIRAAIPGESAQVEWMLCEQVDRIEGVPDIQLTATDAPTNSVIAGDVQFGTPIPLSVRAQAEACTGSTVLSGQKVTFQVYRGITGTSFMGANDPGYIEAITGASGVATVQLKTGSTTGAVTVLATFGDTPPVRFDLNVVGTP